MNEKPLDPHGNIWITSRVRMNSHSRLVFWDKASHLMLTTYSVALLGVSIFDSHIQATKFGTYSSEISILLSVSILCASLIIWSFSLGHVARDHRDCYLALQSLYSSEMSASEKNSKYQSILEKFPNHSKWDYEYFLFDKIWIQGGSVTTSNGKVRMGKIGVAKFLSISIAKILTICMIAFFPAILIFILYQI